MFSAADGKLFFRYDSETLLVESWGRDAFRVRATHETIQRDEDWALLKPSEEVQSTTNIETTNATIRNGNIIASITAWGKLSITDQNDRVLLEEFSRNRLDPTDPKCSALSVHARQFKPILGGDYHLTARFESLHPEEKIFGMGQYQQSNLDLKGADLELAHRNSQASVPFAVSSLGYGFLWNNPAIGRAVFGRNQTTFEAYSTKGLDYWIVAGASPSAILGRYAQVTGTVPMMPDYGLGFWQSKLRYQTQDEVLHIARGFKERRLPLGVLVIDFFHWPLQGEWKFDPTYWPDPGAMIEELKAMGVELMVSIWPTVDQRSENYSEMLQNGFLIRQDRGYRISMDFQGNTVHFDATNPAARKYVWDKVQKNYCEKGVRTFWLDEAEPEYNVYDFDIYRYHRGTNLSIGNIYPREYARAFYEGMAAQGQTEIVNLARCAWAGSQRFGALVWSGDIASSWSSLRNQLSAGLNMGMAGIPWWTTDIGGFHGGNPDDPAFRELFVRWFQWGTYCPVMRNHGDREPRQPPQGTTGGANCASGAANEPWSYGEEVLNICRRYMDIRVSMRSYIRQLMLEAHQHGTPVMRPLFYDYPEDPKCWTVDDQYMFGPLYLVAPVLKPGQTSRSVYFPIGRRWTQAETTRPSVPSEDPVVYEGGTSAEVTCPLEVMPVFLPVDN